MKRFLVFTAVVILVLGSIAQADVPRLLNFQGRLNTPADTNVSDGVYTVRFRIYDDSTIGNVLWEETGPVQVTGGIFNALLGSTTPVHDSVFILPNRWLGIKVNFDPEMTPRQRLSSVGYRYVSSQWTSAAENLFRLNGNVGIGTANPQNRLHIYDASGTINPRLIIESNHPNVYYPGIDLKMGDVVGEVYTIQAFKNTGLYFELPANRAIHFRSAGTERLKIATNGNVGIGTATPGVRKLHIYDNDVAGIRLEASGPPSQDWLLSTDQINTPGGLIFYDFRKSAYRMVIDSSGNVGVGTTNPSLSLDIVGTPSVDGYNRSLISVEDVSPSGVGAGAGIQFRGKYNGAGSSVSFAGLQGIKENSTEDNIAGALVFNVNFNGGVPLERMRISSAGNVGIGTSNPTERRLHIYDNVNAGIRLQHIGGGNADWIISTDAVNPPQGLIFYDRNAPGYRLVIDSSGKVGIGTHIPTQKLEVAGTIYSTTGGFRFPDNTVQTTASAGGGGLPSGVIVMWSGDTATIPSGWALCNGANGTPDLRDRFIYGVSPGQQPGTTGGLISHSHTVNAHSHTVNPPPTPTGGPSTFTGMMGGGLSVPSPIHTHIFDVPSTVSTLESPGTNLQSNLPPYFKLAFIMKL